MKVTVEISRGATASWEPDQAQCEAWINQALQQSSVSGAVSVSLRFVGTDESAALNTMFRSKNGPTNVLSFPTEMPQSAVEALGYQALGDIVICSNLVETEAEQQKKGLPAHWAHLIIHGTLHLLGHDHQEDASARAMEGLEIIALERLGFPNPYLIG